MIERKWKGHGVLNKWLTCAFFLHCVFFLLMVSHESGTYHSNHSNILASWSHQFIPAGMQLMKHNYVRCSSAGLYLCLHYLNTNSLVCWTIIIFNKVWLHTEQLTGRTSLNRLQRCPSCKADKSKPIEKPIKWRSYKATYHYYLPGLQKTC